MGAEGCRVGAVVAGAPPEGETQVAFGGVWAADHSHSGYTVTTTACHSRCCSLLARCQRRCPRLTQGCSALGAEPRACRMESSAPLTASECFLQCCTRPVQGGPLLALIPPQQMAVGAGRRGGDGMGKGWERQRETSSGCAWNQRARAEKPRTD